MKNRGIKILFLSIVLFEMTSCTKSELTKYEQPDMIYVYKDPFNTKADSTTYSFALSAPSLLVDTVKVAVRIMGLAQPFAREVKFSPIASGSTAVESVHFSFLPYTIPAGEYKANLPIIVKRTASMKTQDFRLQLQIVETKDFKPGIANSPVSGNFAGASLQYLIKINDYLTKPSNWDSQLVAYFGAYSQVKYKFIIVATDRTVFTLGAPPLMSIGELTYCVALSKSKLVIYNAANGPLLDEFGAVVTFP